MDAKITLSFDQDIIRKAKRFAEKNDISLSRLTEFLYAKITSDHYQSLEELPVSDWVNILSEGEAEYITKAKKQKSLRAEYFKSRK